MPYLKSIPIHSTVNRSLRYILNPEKTEKLLYTASLNCMADWKLGYENMKLVYEQYSKKSFDEPLVKGKKNRVKAIHYIQSFDPADEISPELAHRIGKAFARKCFGDNVQVVIATHTDKSHIHNHLIINSYGIDGEKFISNKKTLDQCKQISDGVCLALGIQPYDKTKGRNKTLAYNEWEHKHRGTSWKQKICLQIDRLIYSVKNIDELLYELELLGYTVKRGKYISVKADGQERFVRFKTLGVAYTEESLSIRIADAYENPMKPEKAITEMAQIYYNRISEIADLVKTNRKSPRKYNSSLPYSVENDYTVYMLAAQLAVINKDKIMSISHLENSIEELQTDCKNIRDELNTLLSKQSQINTVIEQCEKYFELLQKPELSALEQLKLNIYKTTADNAKVTDESKIEFVRGLKTQYDEKISALTAQFDEVNKKISCYANIAKTYYDISKGDYISRVVEQERQWLEQEKEKNAPKKGRGR